MLACTKVFFKQIFTYCIKSIKIKIKNYTVMLILSKCNGHNNMRILKIFRDLNGGVQLE